MAKCAFAVPSASIAAISASLSTEAPRETCQPTISIGSFERKTARAASGSTQMLYSAAGVTLPSQHGAPPITTQRPILSGERGIARQRQRDIGQRPERHQRQARLGAREAQDRVDRMLALGRALRRGIAVIAEAVARHETSARAHARGSAARRRRRRRERPSSQISAVSSALRVACSRPTLPATVVSAEHPHVRRGERHHDRDGVVGGGVGVDEEIAQLQPPLCVRRVCRAPCRMI